MCYMLYGLAINLIQGCMQYAPTKPNQQINESTNQLTDFSLFTFDYGYLSGL